MSDFNAIKHSVPQGSVIGPILFLLCVKDLPFNIQGAKMVPFSDDINIQIKLQMKTFLKKK
jgi:hypothetical protein